MFMFYSINGQVSVEDEARFAFEFFKQKKFKTISKTQFANQAEFWDYTWISLGSVDSLNSEENKERMEDLRLEFKEKFLLGLENAFKRGEDDFGIVWDQVQEYKIEIHKRTLEVKEYNYEMIIPVVSFVQNGEKLMWGFESYVFTREEKYRICAKTCRISKYKEL